MVSDGSLPVLGVKKDGTLWGWGSSNQRGQQGNGTNVSHSEPFQIGTGTTFNAPAVTSFTNYTVEVKDGLESSTCPSERLTIPVTPGFPPTVYAGVDQEVWAQAGFRCEQVPCGASGSSSDSG